MVATAGKPARKRLLVQSAKAVVSGGLIAAIIWKIGPETLLAAVARYRPVDVVWVLVLSALFITGRGLKWTLVARAANPELRHRDGVISVIGGLGLGMITPGRLGEFTRVAFMPGGDRVGLTGLFVIDRAIDLLTVALYGTAAAFLLGYWAVAMGGALICVAGVGVLASLRTIAPRLQRIVTHLPFERYTSRMLAAGALVTPGRLGIVLVVSCLATAAGYVQFYLLVVSASAAPPPVAGAVFTFSLMILSNLLPISIAGLGVREAVAAVSLTAFHIARAVAVNASFLSYLTNTVLPGVIGALLWSNVKQRAPESGALNGR